MAGASSRRGGSEKTGGRSYLMEGDIWRNIRQHSLASHDEAAVANNRRRSDRHVCSETLESASRHIGLSLREAVNEDSRMDSEMVGG